MVLRAAAALFVVGAALAGASLADEPVRVYTNADLEALPPLATQAVPVAEIEGGWDFVAEFLARHDGRLDADRGYALDRLRTEAEVEHLDDDRIGYGLALAPGWYGPRHHRKPRHERIENVLTTDYANRIVPLHARPSQADLMRFDAYRRSGADAVPRRGPKPSALPPAPAPAPRGAVAHAAGTAVLGGKRRPAN